MRFHVHSIFAGSDDCGIKARALFSRAAVYWLLGKCTHYHPFSYTWRGINQPNSNDHTASLVDTNVSAIHCCIQS